VKIPDEMLGTIMMPNNWQFEVVNEWIYILDNDTGSIIAFQYYKGLYCWLGTEEHNELIFNPQNVIISKSGIKIGKASKIIWKFYYYGKPQQDQNLITVQYEIIDDSHIRIIESGINNRDIISSQGENIAFDSYGNINESVL
jgi:hypothetical protein